MGNCWITLASERNVFNWKSEVYTGNQVSCQTLTFTVRGHWSRSRWARAMCDDQSSGGGIKAIKTVQTWAESKHDAVRLDSCWFRELFFLMINWQRFSRLKLLSQNSYQSRFSDELQYTRIISKYVLMKFSAFKLKSNRTVTFKINSYNLLFKVTSIWCCVEITHHDFIATKSNVRPKQFKHIVRLTYIILYSSE